jgi:hypothetical protein
MALLHEGAPPAALSSSLKLVAWYATRTGHQRVFSKPPSDAEQSALAGACSVEGLEQLRNGLSMAALRSMGADDAAYVALLITPKGCEADVLQTRVFFVEGFCGVGVETCSGSFRELVSPSDSKLFGGHSAGLNFTAEVLAENRALLVEPRAAHAQTTINLATATLAVVKRMCADVRQRKIRMIVCNKLSGCRQRLAVVGATPVVVCCNECDEAASNQNISFFERCAAEPGSPQPRAVGPQAEMWRAVNDHVGGLLQVSACCPHFSAVTGPVQNTPRPPPPRPLTHTHTSSSSSCR